MYLWKYSINYKLTILLLYDFGWLPIHNPSLSESVCSLIVWAPNLYYVSWDFDVCLEKEPKYPVTSQYTNALIVAFVNQNNEYSRQGSEKVLKSPKFENWFLKP